MSLNLVVLQGNVGQDPELRALESGVEVANFSVAMTERGYTKKDGSTVPDKTEWIEVNAWRGLATIVDKYVKKGSQILVQGKLTTRKYEKDGVVHYKTSVTADNIELLGKPSVGSQHQEPTADTPNIPDFGAPTSDDDELPF